MVGADSFATYVLGKPDAGKPPVRFDEGRQLADLPRLAAAYSTPFRSTPFRSTLQIDPIVSKDEDFARLTLVRPEPVAVVWLRMGNCRTTVLLATLERAWPDLAAQLDAGARLIEIF